MRKSWLILPLLAVAELCAQKVNWIDQIQNKPAVDVRQFQWFRTGGAGASSPSLSTPGSKTVSFTTCPKGLLAGQSIYIEGGTGTPELVSLTATTCDLSSGAAGTISFTTANSHSGATIYRSATAGVQEAISSVGIEGGMIELPCGQYVFRGTATVNEDYLHIRGGGSCTEIKSYASGAALRFLGTGGGDHNANIGEGNSLSDLRLDGLSAGANSIGIELENQNNHTIRNVSGTGFKYFEKQYGSNLYRTRWDGGSVGYQLSGGSAFWLADGADTYFSEVAVGLAPDAAWLITKSGGFTIKSASVLYCQDGLRLAPSGTDTVHWGFVDNSMFDTNTGTGINFQPTGSGSVSGIVITSSWTSSNALIGVKATATSPAKVSGVKFIGHRSINNAQDGFSLIGSGVDKFDIDSSIISGNSSSSSGSYPGIRVGSGVSSVSITNNHIGLINAVAIAPFPGFLHLVGILLETGVGGDLIVTGNRIDNYQVSSIFGASNLTSTYRYKFRDNTPDAFVTLPVASAFSLSLTETPFPRYTITGNTNIATMAPVWEGREVELIATDATPGGIVTGGNFATALTFTRNVPVRCSALLTVWYCK